MITTATEPTRHAAEGDNEGELQRLPMPISEAFVGEILRPYRLHARYLKSATITQFCPDVGGPDSNTSIVTGVGTFSIPESCYIDDTGHFNAVEFNICFNQLAYVVFGKCIEAGLIHPIWSENSSPLSVDEYKDDQLPSMMIVRIDKMRFLKQMRSDGFAGELKVNKMTQLGSAWFFFTSISFYDNEGIKAQGSVVLAYSRDFKPN
jgi:hypothetical protein